MANIKIYRDDAAGVVYFENSTVNPAPVNVCVATEVVGQDDRIKIERTDKFIKGTNDFRVLFKRLNFTRIRDINDNSFATREDAINYLTAQFAQAAPVDVNASYLGVWDAGTNNPDIVALSPENGDWFYVTATGSIDPNGDGTATGSINYRVDDIVKYCDQPSFTGWQYIPNETIRVDELDNTINGIINNSSLTQYDIHVNSSYTGSENLGTAIKPYTDIQQAINASTNGNTILLDGNFTITASIELPTDKMLHFYGAGETTVGYATFSPLNGNVFHRTSGDSTKGFQFEDLTFKNAGGYGLHIEESDQIYVIDCTFNTNGWNGTGLSTSLPESGGTLGYDSSQADLLTFGSGSNVSDGGALKISNTKNVQIIGCTAQSNFRGFKVEDCGIGGNIFITRNVASGNIESGIYLAASTLKGTQNATVMMNFAGYNSNNGLLVVGGINNKFSQNEVTGNWNGGFVSWGAANTTVRDSGFYDNNRSAYNGIGANGDADASILINDSYSYLETHFHLNPSARFITEILGCQIQNTGLGSNTEKIGVALTSGMGSIPDNDKNIIRIDDCGFIAQDYAIDFSACDITNLRVSLGDNTYEGTGQFAVKAPLLGDYAELPYSSHVTDVNAVDIVTDVLKQSVTLCEGVGGNVINIYKVNELQSYINGGNKITLIQRGSDRIQLRSLSLSQITINGEAAGNTITAANDNLNAAFQLTLEQYQGVVVTPLLDALTPISGYNTPLVGSLVGDDLSNGGVVQTTDQTTPGDRIFIPSGSITVGTTFGFLVGNTISTTPTSTDWEFSIVIDETGSLTFSNNDGSISNDVLQLGTIAGETWDSHIIIDLQSNGTTIDFATSNLLTTASLLPSDATTYSVEITSGSYNLTFFNQAASGTIEIPADGEVLEGNAPVGLAYYYIESPNGVFHYPLFTDLPQAQYEDIKVGGPGSGSSYTFVDDLSSQGTWYAPITSYSGSVNAAPVNGTPTGVTWNEIPNGADANFAPTALSPFTSSLDELTTLNQQIHPVGATWTTTIANGPAWITLNGQSNLVGTAPEVDGDSTNYPKDSYTLDVIRTNDYGSSTSTIRVEVTNLTSLLSLPGTIHTGSAIVGAGNNNAGLVYTGPTSTSGQFVYDIDTLEDGDSIEWYHQEQYLGFGIVSNGVDKTTNILDKDSAPGTRWDLLAPFTGTPTDAQGQNFGNASGMVGLVPVGWDDNTNPQAIPTRPVYSTTDVWKLYNNAGTIELSLNGTLFRSSSATYTDPTITFATPAFLVDSTLPIPTFNKVANGASAPSGFTLTHGTMDTSFLLNGDSVVTLDNLTLAPGKRLIIPNTWINSNVLPHIDGSNGEDNKVFIGVPKTGSIWGSVDISDFYSVHRIENQTLNLTKLTQYYAGPSPLSSDTNINSDADILYNLAIENTRGGDLVVMRSLDSNPSLTTEPVEGGTFNQIDTFTTASDIVGTGSLDLVIATKGTETRVNLTTSGLSVIDAPIPSNQFNVTEDSFSLPLFNGDSGTTLTLNAGQTYKFWLDDSSIESTDTLSFVLTSDNSAYTTGVTTVGTPGTFGAYVEFTIPSDVPPVKFKWVSTGSGTTYITPTIAGSTYVDPVTGITLEGPSGNQTGTNITDNGDYGWASIDETLAAGERFVMDNAFFTDLLAEMGDQYEIRIGLKGTNWANTAQSTKTNSAVTGEVFRGDIQLRISRSTNNNIYLQLFKPGAAYNQMLVNTVSLHNTVCGFIELTSSGNNIRFGFGRNGSTGNITQGDESTVIYSDWNAYKGETGNQSYGISSIDVMFLVTDIFNGNNDDYDGANVDWTNLSEVSTPTAPTITTDWDKAIDFSGGNEHLKQVSANQAVNPIGMGGLSAQASANSDSSKTSDHTNSRPWATSTVFRVDGNNSNQHIWNFGEGAGSGDDNIYLRLSSTRQLFLGWGRDGVGYNECLVASSINANQWYGIYIAHKGARYGSSNATSTNLADAFDIRLTGASSSWVVSSSNLSSQANWNSGTTGVRMDRAFVGDLTIGGRGSNRNFHGKVASMVVTTLKQNQTMPTDNEIHKMITDPEDWLLNFKQNQPFRYVNQAANFNSNFTLNTSNSGYATQVWLMGDGTNDSYSNGIRNQVNPGEQNYTKLQLNSMVSNDIETVTISGLT